MAKVLGAVPPNTILRRPGRRGSLELGCILWQQVTKVHRLSESYFLALENEAMPVPHRCVRGDERQFFENHVNDKRGL
jgi:hypothetical protein